MLAIGRGLAADNVAIPGSEKWIKTRRDPDGHRQGRRAGRLDAVPHPDPDRTVRNPHARDAEILVTRDMPLHIELVDVSIGQVVDVNRFHVAVQLGDLLLEGHRGAERARPILGREAGVEPRPVGMRLDVHLDSVRLRRLRRIRRGCR